MINHSLSAEQIALISKRLNDLFPTKEEAERAMKLLAEALQEAQFKAAEFNIDISRIKEIEKDVTKPKRYFETLRDRWGN